MKQINVLVINGPNLNLLGEREPEKYGRVTLKEIIEKMKKYERAGINFKFFQSNSEGAIIDKIHEERFWADYLIINAGAYTHTSIAIRDAIAGTGLLTIEVHLTNIYKREDYRRKSYISEVAVGVISGFGWYGYIMALEYILEVENEKREF